MRSSPSFKRVFTVFKSELLALLESKALTDPYKELATELVSYSKEICAAAGALRLKIRSKAQAMA